MAQAAAKQGDRVDGIDSHIVMVPTPSGPPVPSPLPHAFSGSLSGQLSNNVNIMGRAAATVGSTAFNSPPHLPTAPGTVFQKPPGNQATVHTGSFSVFINGKAAARHGDRALTCNDPADLLNGTLTATGSVAIG